MSLDLKLEREAYLRNSVFELSKARSYVVEVLTGPNDQHIKDNLLDLLSEAEWNIRKGLL
jgi:hypothetical protein